MTEDVFVSIRGLHALQEAPDEDIEVIFPGTCRQIGDLWYVRYDEPVEGMDGRITNLIKVKSGCVEVTKRGLTNTHMVFEEGKKNVTWYETPLGSIELGIAATSVQVTDTPETLEALAVYALEVNQVTAADCMIRIRVSARPEERTKQ